MATEIVPYSPSNPRPGGQGELHLSKARREILAEYKAQGRLLDESDYKQAARILDVDLATIKKWDADDSVNVRAMQKFQPRAFASLVKNWPVIEECMREKKSWAFKLAAQISTVLPVGGVSFQQNVAIDARSSGVGDNHRQFAQNFWNRVKESRLNGSVIDAEVEVGDDSA